MKEPSREISWKQKFIILLTIFICIVVSTLVVQFFFAHDEMHAGNERAVTEQVAVPGEDLGANPEAGE